MATRDKNQLMISGNVTFVKDSEKCFTFFVRAMDGKYGVTVPCVAFREAMSQCKAEINVNSRVLVIGKMIANNYEKNGEKRYELKVMVDEVCKLPAVAAEEAPQDGGPPPWDR